MAHRFKCARTLGPATRLSDRDGGRRFSIPSDAVPSAPEKVTNDDGDAAGGWCSPQSKHGHMKRRAGRHLCVATERTAILRPTASIGWFDL